MSDTITLASDDVHRFEVGHRLVLDPHTRMKWTLRRKRRRIVAKMVPVKTHHGRCVITAIDRVNGTLTVDAAP